MSYLKVKIFMGLVLFALMLNFSEGTDKLQIGIKKRIPTEECKVKTKSGDHLKMHYTVCQISICR